MNISDLLSSLKDPPPSSETWKDTTFFGRLAMFNLEGKRISNYLELDINNGPFLAGGAVRKCFLMENIGNSDWDIFFKDIDQFNKYASKLATETKAQLLCSSDNALTYVIEGNKIQLVKRKFYNNYQEIIDDFDFTICQFVTDGNVIKVGEYSIVDSKHKIINNTRHVLDRPGIMGRLVKYIVYGYSPTNEFLKQIEAHKHDIDYTTRTDDYSF